MLDNVILFLPELFYGLMALVLFGLSLADGKKARVDFYTAWVLGAIGLVITVACLMNNGELFFKAYRVDMFSQLFKLFMSLGLFLVLCVSAGMEEGVDEHFHPEFYLFLTTATLGMFMLVSAVEMITLYVALELSSYSLYLLVPLRKRGGRDTEAAVKYFFVGAVSSAVMLFGMSYLFGVTQTTYIPVMLAKLPAVIAMPGAVIGLVLTMCGLFFKLAVFPFHAWAPDVYEGGANQLVAYIATASKMAGVAILVRLTALAGLDSLYFVNVLIILSIVCMTFGNLVAIKQRDFKRLLAYSSIAHGGYILLGLLNISELGFAAVIFYAAAYLVLSFACFMVIILVSEQGRNVSLEDFAGLHSRSPLLAMLLLLGVFGLAGLPPTAGFTGKLFIFLALLKSNYLWLAVLAMVNVTISLYYYIGVVKAAYLAPPAEGSQPITLSLPMKVLSYAVIALIVYLGVGFQALYNLAEKAALAVM